MSLEFLLIAGAAFLVDSLMISLPPLQSYHTSILLLPQSYHTSIIERKKPTHHAYQSNFQIQCTVFLSGCPIHHP